MGEKKEKKKIPLRKKTVNCESVNIAAVADGGEEREEENTPSEKKL